MLGELDLATAPRLAFRIDAARQAGARRLVVDLTAAEFCDSTGLRALVGCRHEVVAGGGRMALAVLEEQRGRPHVRARGRPRADAGLRRPRARPGRARSLSTAAVLLALGAAVMHAAWTLLLARAPDTDAATAAALAIAVVVFAPFAALGWDVERAAVPYIALSAVFEIGFFAMLALALRSGEVGLVYPLSRGVAPVLVLLVGVVALGTHVSAAQAAGSA
jgi:drug/metabolite transporter (DMT)-like permease